MNALFLDDSNVRAKLFPFAELGSVADLRIGILTIREKWLALKPDLVMVSAKEPDSMHFSANVIPTKAFVNLRSRSGQTPNISGLTVLEHPWQIFQLNDQEIRRDFAMVTANRVSANIPESNRVVCPENIFVEEGARVDFAILNGSAGPIYIGRNAVVMEGSVVRGPVAICEGATVKMNTRIYGATTIGPHCNVGGEIKNSVMLGYSNKAHDGYLGDSVIGEWCNLGAGTSNSNVKNNAGEIKAWSNAARSFTSAGMKCGLLMGDYSRAAINTSFNSGTVTGIGCNIFGNGLTPKFIPSFSWGFNPLRKYIFEKAVNDINNWKKLKNQFLSETEVRLLRSIFETI